MARIPAATALFVGAWMAAVEGGSLRGAQQTDALWELIDLLEGDIPPPSTYLGARVRNVTEAMHPIFLSLPQTDEGYLEATATHYLLHRYFIDQDGWFVRGAEVVGEAAGDNLPDVLLGPDGGTLSKRLVAQLRSTGLRLRDVVVLALAVEILAKLETETRLAAAYGLAGDYNASKTHRLFDKEMQKVYKVYLQIYVLGRDVTELTKGDVQETFDDIHNQYPLWDSLLSWVQEVRAEVLAKSHICKKERNTFDGEVCVLEVVQHRYGKWQNQACMTIKAGFREYLLPGTGRMPLTTFYTTNIPNAMGWKPDESEEYLQHVGALDTTNPENPSVVMSNYFDTPSNCAGPSQFYDVCCINDCESLLGHLEKKLGSPKAPVQQIVDIVESMSSATVEAPRSLPGQLIKRLESVADTHGGHAPLHGRLFLQWMHHAFPAECSMPPLYQKTALHIPMHSAEFEEKFGMQATISVEKLQKMYIAAAKQTKTVSSAIWESSALAEDLPWSQEEELFIVCRADDPASGISPTVSKVRSAWRGSLVLPVLGFAGIIMAVVSHLVTSVRSLKATLLPICKEKAKYLV